MTGKGVHSQQVKNIAMLFKAKLQKCDGLVLDEAFAVKTKHRWWVTRQDLMAEAFYKLRCLDQRVTFPSLLPS